jgi:hypothetical protein
LNLVVRSRRVQLTVSDDLLNTIRTYKHRAGNVQTEFPQFGERIAGNNYTYRPGAYAVVFDADQRVAVVKNKYGYYFLLAGGAEPSETMEETLHREVLEESGYDSNQGKLSLVFEY